MTNSVVFTFVAIACVSAIPLLALLILVRHEQRLTSMLPYLISLAAGALLGAALFHLMPEAAELFGAGKKFGCGIFAGFFGFLLLERFLRLHQHVHRAHDEHRTAPFAVLNLAGDAVHNFIDGAIIGAAFMMDTRLGVTTTFAVILHEVPQELGDFGVLVHAGHAPLRAIMLNFAVATTAFAGGAATHIAGARMEAVVHGLLPVSAGMFLYIAASDLIPELQREDCTSRSVAQVSLVLAGALLLMLLA
ncbi:MAG: ZIP family metal transporter [Gemmatimonadota bacterium]